MELRIVAMAMAAQGLSCQALRLLLLVKSSLSLLAVYLVGNSAAGEGALSPGLVEGSLPFLD